MGFTTPCFIRKNTEALRKNLEEVGYKMLSPIEYDNLECSDNWVNDINHSTTVTALIVEPMKSFSWL